MSTDPDRSMPPDTLTQELGVLKRREVEARILAPIVKALGDRFGRDEVVEVVKKEIIEMASAQGSALAETLGGCGSEQFVESLVYWTKDDALKLEVLKHTEEELHFNVKRCRYAEMYRSLGIPELGAVFSCNRDFALIDGFNPEATLKRTQTIMEGATHCDFRYSFPSDASSEKS